MKEGGPESAPFCSQLVYYKRLKPGRLNLFVAAIPVAVSATIAFAVATAAVAVVAGIGTVFSRALHVCCGASLAGV